MTKETRTECLNMAWEGMEQMQKGKEIASSVFQSMLFETFYKIFFILYQLLDDKRKER